MLQTILVPKNHFTKSEAIQWVMRHHHVSKIDTTDKYYRFRQQPPNNGHYYTITLPNRIELVYEQ